MGERDVWTDREIERVVSMMLRIGVSTATVVVLTGGILFLIQHGHETPQLATFRGEPAELRTFRGLLGAVGRLEAPAIVQLGIVLLVATPIARVALSLYGFLRQRDTLFVLVTAIVLTVLLVGLLSGSSTSSSLR
jgi:uncharacterized membrane protein